jgi:MerR family regulatory protein
MSQCTTAARTRVFRGPSAAVGSLPRFAGLAPAKADDDDGAAVCEQRGARQKAWSGLARHGRSANAVRSEPSTHTSPRASLPPMADLPAGGWWLLKEKGASMDDVPDNQYLRTFEVAAELGGVSPKTVTRWAKAGKLPYLRTLGGHRATPPGRSASWPQRWATNPKTPPTTWARRPTGWQVKRPCPIPTTRSGSARNLDRH